MKKILFIFLLLFIAQKLLADNGKVDSLQNQLNTVSANEKVDVLISLSELMMIDSSKKAIEYSNQAYELAKSLKYEQGQALAAFNCAKIFRAQDKYDQALKYLQIALELFENLKNNEMTAKCLIEFGLNYFMTSDLPSAIENFTNALYISKQLNDSSAISSAYYNLGRCYRKSGDLDSAIENSMKSLEFKAKNNHYALNVLSIIYGMQGKFNQSLKYQKRALKIRKKLDLKNEVIGSLNNLGLISAYMGDTEKSLQYLSEAIKIAEEIGKKSELNKVLNNMGFVFGDILNKQEKALQYYQQSLKISKEIGEKYEIINTLTNIGIVQSKLKNSNQAIHNLEESLRMARDIDAKELVKNNFMSLTEHYERTNNFRKALENYKSFVAVRDTIFNKQSEERISELRVKYETGKMEKENEIIRLRVEKEELAKTRLYLALTITGLLIIILVVFYLYKIKRNKLLNKEIAERKKIENELEIRIKKRTKELEKLKDELEIKVDKQTKELQAKVEKLSESENAMLFMIEDLNRMTKELDNEKKQLERSNENLESFSYSVSHDLRAPLRAIDGFVRILLEDYATKLDDEGKRIANVIQQNTEKMGKLIDDLLSFSRLGRQTINLSKIDMKTMINSIYHEVTDADEREQIEFNIGALPEIKADTNMIRIVWQNLISNAVKFTSKEKKPLINIRSVDDDSFITYQIKDNGVGFDSEYSEDLFKVFQRLHSEKDYSGTGVGLALVKRIIERHNGKIRANSETGKGASFYFSLPKL